LQEKDVCVSLMIKRYFDHYAWVGINKWEGLPNSIENLVTRLNETIKNIAEKNYITTNEEDISHEENINPLVLLGVATAYWRPTCAGYAAQFEYVIRERIKSLGNKHSLTYEDCLNFSQDELIDLEETGVCEIKQDILHKRSESSAQYEENGSVVTITQGDDQYEQLCKLYGSTPKESQSGEEGLYKGVSASRGFVRGRVRVVKHQDEFEKFENGDILVAPETTPAFVPLMRKASAILTERGGITSHAAIVSRELKVPCIISVQGITKILKDGMEVEVDAERGVVTILKE
jgi:phosphohistidine swiveling domain-containing protein